MYCLTVTYPAPRDSATDVPNYSPDGATIFHFVAGA